MKILYLTTSFPRKGEGDTIYTDLANEFYLSGHELIVCVSDQKIEQKMIVLKDRGFIEYRIRVPKYYNVGILKKGLSLLQQPHCMKKEIKKIKGLNNIDLILYESPPISNASIVKMIKRKFGGISYLMLKDIFPQNAIDLGIITTKNPMYHYFKKKEKQLYNVSDLIGCMSNKNIRYLCSNYNINPLKVKYFPNTKKISELSIKTTDIHEVRKTYNIPIESTVFIFGGNMGKPQYMEIHKRIILYFMNRLDIFFIYIGRGTERYIVKDLVQEMSIRNVLILDEVPRIEYEKLLVSADIGMITLDPRFTIPNFPSRILSYMEFSKPVFAATDGVTDIQDLLMKAKNGYWVNSTDSQDVINMVKDIIISKNRLSELGANGRRYLEENLTVFQSVKLIEKHLNEVLEHV
ncbi:MAG: glycosyltransferase family 4 protein [Bacilli bacterium]|nr:glycosyltransferase family 4 protein [Bacilli bacterium]